MQTQIIGDAIAIKAKDNQLVIQSEEAEVRVAVYSPTIIRVCITRNKDADESFAVIRESEDSLSFTEDQSSIEIKTSMLSLKIDKAPLRFSFFSKDGKLLSTDDERYSTNWQGERVITYRKLFTDEKFIGLGEKTGDLNRHGCNYINWNSDVPDYTPKTDPLYQTFPFFIGLHSGLTYGLFFDNTHKSYFDFGASTNNKMSWFGADGGDMNYYFFGAQSVAEIIKDYTWLTGRMEMPPLWSLGYQQCRWSYMSANELLDIAQTFRDKQIPADVLYCDIDYMEKYKVFTWNKETFTDPKGLVDDLTELDFKLVTIIDPGIKIEKGYKQYEEGIENGFFATYPDGENYTGSVWPGPCHFPDFYREEVREWWGEACIALTEAGVAGFWNDMNEPATWGQNMPWMMKFGERYMSEVRNAYGMQMARATYDGTRRLLGNRRPFVLTRAAYSGTQRYSAVWTGDNTATDAHMLLGQRLVNSLGLTGMAMVGVDIGGFSGNPTPELMVRWNSLGVYTPIFRNHAMQGTIYREPWQWGEANEAIIKKDIEQRYRLLPYIYSSFYQSSQTGMPVSRTLAIAYTADENIYETRYQNQFLFGDNILVAPVVSTAETIEVYLPEGDWYRYSSDKKFTGGQSYKVSAPLTDLPVFVKAGGIVPIQHVIQSTAEKGDGVLELHIWNGTETSSYIYYEDDGTTYDYQHNIYYKREIIFDPEKMQLRLSAVEGTFKSRFGKMEIVLHGFDGCEEIALIKLTKDVMVVDVCDFESLQ